MLPNKTSEVAPVSSFVSTIRVGPVTRIWNGARNPQYLCSRGALHVPCVFVACAFFARAEVEDARARDTCVSSCTTGSAAGDPPLSSVNVTVYWKYRKYYALLATRPCCHSRANRSFKRQWRPLR